MRSEELRPGDVVAGKYRVHAVLGRSRGLLLEAFHVEFDQRVAIRVLAPSLCDDREVERFRRECRVLAKLESEHVARIIDVGSLPDGGLYLVRQFLDGRDLRVLLRDRGALPFEEAVDYALQIAEAVAETHVHAILLRELSPAHVFVGQRVGGEPLVKVIDFGVAKLMREVASTAGNAEVTATAAFGMTPYSSPELVRNARGIDGRTDVWSLGAILYEMLAGRAPFAGHASSVMLAILSEDPVPITSLRPDVPSGIEGVIAWAIAKDADRRFASVYAFAAALAPWASPEGRVLVQRIGHLAQVEDHARATGADPGRASRPPSRPPPPRVEREDGTATEIHRPSSVVEVRAGTGDPGSNAPSAPPKGPLFAGAASGITIAQTPAPSGAYSAAPAPYPAIPPAPALPSEAIAPRGPDPPASSPDPEAARWGLTPPTLVHAAPDEAAADRHLRSVAVVAILGTCVLLPMLVGLVLVKARSRGAEIATGRAVPALSALAAPAAASNEPANAAAADPRPAPIGDLAPVATSDPAPAPTADPAPAPSPLATSAPAPTATAAAVVEIPPPPPRASAAAPSNKPASPAPTGPKPIAAPAAPSPVAFAGNAPPAPVAAAGASQGTLVAVAVGGTCAFSVNGAAKGTATNLKLRLEPGVYSVACKPEGGGAKATRSVTVTAGATAMTAFRL